MNFKKMSASLNKNKFVRTFRHITYANVLSLAFFIVNFFLFLFFSGMFDDYHDRYDYIQDLILAIPMSTAFPFMLLRVSKKMNLVCDGEILLDYEIRDYISVKHDFPIVWRRERLSLFYIVVINAVTSLLTNLDILISGKPTVTGIFALYVPMRILAVAIPFSEILGVVVATLYACALYLFLVLRYRKKRYAVMDHDFRLSKYKK